MDENAVIRGSQEPNALMRRGECGQKHTQKTPRGDTDTEGGWPCKDRGRDQSAVEEARKGPPLEASEGEEPHKHFDFGLLAPKTVKRINVCFFKPHSLWYIIIAALGN